MPLVPSADAEPVDYTKWSDDDLSKLRSLQRDDGADPTELEAVEQELHRRSSSTRLVAPPPSARPPVSAPALAQTRIAPVVKSDEASALTPSRAPRKEIEEPPFEKNSGRRGFVSAITVGFVFAALAAAVGGAIVAYSLGEGLGGGRVAFALLVAVIAAMPYLAIVAFLDLASEAAQGVTWIARFLHEQASE